VSMLVSKSAPGTMPFHVRRAWRSMHSKVAPARSRKKTPPCTQATVGAARQAAIDDPDVDSKVLEGGWSEKNEEAQVSMLVSNSAPGTQPAQVRRAWRGERWSSEENDMVSTIKVGMGCAKSTYLRNHTFKSPVTRTDTRS
jgi:hypothetical protein